ncbi:phosphotransferase [Nocardioides sp. Root190]|uniref:phosphotransferase n=1 Tax=Nocardioides sp. Root190 TaxID=1736488 RepID=UPI00138F227A|nr:phosphotransferase [Nocardioides sp. Root190]
MSTWSSAVWAGEEFLADLRAFVAGAIGEPDRVDRVALRPWSAVWRVSAGGEVAYAKQNCPGQLHEAGLVATLAEVAPGRLPRVLAVDRDRGLLLTSDLGPTLEEQGRGGDVDVWCRIVAESAALQRRVRAAGVDLALTTMAPCDASTYLANAVGHLAALGPGDPRRLTPEVAGRLGHLIPQVDRWADRIEDVDLPLTLVHNDLNASNVAVGGNGLRLLDFGDAVVADPLADLLAPLCSLQRELGAGSDDPRLWRVADAALEVWSDLAPMAELRAVLPASLQLARLARVESWRRCVATMTSAEQADWGAVPARWLGLLLEAPPLGVSPVGART